MDKHLHFLSTVLVCITSFSLAACQNNILTEIRQGQKDMMKQIGELRGAVTEVRHGQHEVLKQFEQIKRTVHIENTIPRKVKVKGDETISTPSQRTPAARPTTGLRYTLKVKHPFKKLLPKLSAGLKTNHAASSLPAETSTANTSTITPGTLPVGVIVTAGDTTREDTLGNTTSVLSHTSGAISTVRSTKKDDGSRTSRLTHHAGRQVYLVMSKKQKLIIHNMEKHSTTMKPMTVGVSTLVYDSSRHSVLWVNREGKVGGRFEKNFSQKRLWRFPSYPNDVTIDNEKGLLYMFNHQELQTINLKTGQLKRTRIHVRLPRRKVSAVWVNPKKKSFLLVSNNQRFAGVYEIAQTSFRFLRFHQAPMEMKTSIFLPERQGFLYCDRLHNLDIFHLYTHKHTHTGLRCPSNVVRLLHFNGTVCAITRDGVYSARLGTEGVRTKSSSQMKRMIVPQDMVSTVAEIIEI